MPHTPISRKTASALTKLVVVLMVIQLAVIVYVGVAAHTERDALVDAQRRGCERSKMDRADNADFQIAHKKYIDKVVLAQSVKADVKKAAREAVRTYNRTSADLAKRAKVVCAVEFPKGGYVP